MAAGQSAMTRVIVTRPAADGAEFAAALAAAGMAAILSPVLSIRACLGPAEADDLGAAVFTSANGVRAFAAVLARRDIPAYVVGRATAHAAQAAGFAEIHHAGGDAASLAALVAERTGQAKPAGDIVHFGGEALAGDLVAALAARKVRARRVVAYAADRARALSPDAVAALRSPGAELWVAHFSARSARLFLDLADAAGLGGALKSVGSACLSAAVAAASEKARWARVVVAADPDGGALIEAIRASR